MHFPPPIPQIIAALLTLVSWLPEFDAASVVDAETERRAAIRDEALPHIKTGHDHDTLRWLPYASAYFESIEDAATALCVISYESGGDRYANRGRSRNAKGLFQHLRRHWNRRSVKAGVAGASIFDVDAQFAVAAWLVYSTSSSWHHWTVIRRCPHTHPN